MLFNINILQLVLFTLSVHHVCVSTFDVSSDPIPEKQVTKEENLKPKNDTVFIDPLKVNNKGDQLIEIPLDNSNKVSEGKASDKGISQYAMEGGVVDLSSTALPNEERLETGSFDETTSHSKGSKGRKGVQYPGSSIVARKGVDTLEVVNLNQTSFSVTSYPGKESNNSVNLNNSKIPLNKTEPQTVKPDFLETPTPKVSHPKKPEVVSDVEDVDDFEKYSIIKTSTTGEDYIIIGIVIVLGIWCSIFGALIFYRRAGEYWDRRHYRRMDFLVEGMYND